MLCRSLLFIGFLLSISVPAPAATTLPSCSEYSAATIQARLEQLAAEIRHHDRLYYRELRPEISDAAYDRLFAELVRLEDCFPALATADSPTRQIGGGPAATAQVAHEEPMLSLESAADDSKIAALLRRIETAGEVVDLLVQPKVDGLPVELVYQAGRLFSAATRGDGAAGENVTERMRQVTGIPARLVGDYPARLVVRGEIYADLRLLAAAPPQTDYATPRHLAAATLRAQTPDRRALAALRFFPFALVAAEPESAGTSDRQALAQLAGWGLPVDFTHTRTASTLAEVRAVRRAYLLGRDRQPFAMDGVVVKVDALSLRRRLGEGGRAPRWAAAWKFPPASARTRILAIDWRTGRTGRRTPVADVAPVLLGGVNVGRVSLHSAVEVARFGVRVGDEVVIALAGDAVPQLLAVVGNDPVNDEPPASPSEAAAVTACLQDSPDCREQFLARAVHFVSKTGLNVAGLGRGRLRLLIEAGLVTDLPGIFLLTEEQISAAPGFGARSAQRLAAALAAAARPERERLLSALGIPGVGPVAARRLGERFPVGDALFAATADELAADGQIGRRAAENFSAFFAVPAGRKLLRQLHDLGMLR